MEEEIFQFFLFFFFFLVWKICLVHFHFMASDFFPFTVMFVFQQRVSIDHSIHAFRAIVQNIFLEFGILEKVKFLILISLENTKIVFQSIVVHFWLSAKFFNKSTHSTQNHKTFHHYWAFLLFSFWNKLINDKKVIIKDIFEESFKNNKKHRNIADECLFVCQRDRHFFTCTNWSVITCDYLMQCCQFWRQRILTLKSSP